MAQSSPSTSRTFLRDVVVATLALAALYGLAWGVQFQPVQIPGYLLIVGFDAVAELVGPAGSNYTIYFSLYVLGLGVVGAAVSAALRRQSHETDRLGVRIGVAGALAVVGVLSLLFGLAVLLGTSQRTPVLVTGGAGVVLLGLAGWLAGVIGIRRPV
jgi:hypothetical protein